MSLKHKSTTQNLPSSDARLLVRETLRISADLASSSTAEPSTAATAAAVESVGLRPSAANLGLVEEQFVGSSLRLICCEEMDGRRWKYFAENGGGGGGGASKKQFKNGSIRAVSLHSPQAPVEVCLLTFIYMYMQFYG